MVNYRVDGKTLGDYLFEGGVYGKVFVDIGDGLKPYILSGPPTLKPPHSRHNNMSMTEVWSGGTWVGGNLLAHLEDPEYDPSLVDEHTPDHWRVDAEKLKRALQEVRS